MQWILGERPDNTFEFLERYGSCRVVMVSRSAGSAEVARGVPKLRGTVSGCLSHTKVFHRGREHAKLLTIANGRRRLKAVGFLCGSLEFWVSGFWPPSPAWGR